MTASPENRPSSDTDIWIISDGTYIDEDTHPSPQFMDGKVRPVAYEISDLAKYIISPNPAELQKKLVGYRIDYTEPVLYSLRKRIASMLHLSQKNDRPIQETHLLDESRTPPRLKDKHFESYITQVYGLLKNEEPIIKKLSGLEIDKIADVKGVCEELEGNRTLLNLRGCVEDKIHYIQTYLSRDVSIVLESPQISEGLFDMRGFDFPSFDAAKKHCLLSFTHKGQQKCCVIGPSHQPEGIMDNTKYVGYLRLLQQSIRINPDFRDALTLCMKNEGQPLKLFFYHQLKIDYSQTKYPATYRDVFQTLDIKPNERALVIDSLNNAQLGISFSYLPQQDHGNEKPITTISVMHDIRALEPIKESLPHVYSQISDRISGSGIGHFYFLDSIKGCAQDE